LDPVRRDVILLNFLSWYRNNRSVSDYKKWVKEYAKKNKIKGVVVDTETINSVNPQAFFYCRLSNIGFPINDHEKKIIEDNLNRMKKVKKKEVAKDTVSIQDRMDQKAKEKVGDILSIVDDFVLTIRDRKKSEDKNCLFIDSWIQSNEINPKIASRMVPDIKEDRQQFVDCLNDKSIREHYSHLTDSHIKRIVSFYDMILDAFSEKKTEKKIRTRRVKKVNPVQQTSKVKYLSETDLYGGVKSILPSKIIGATRLVTFNVKTRTFSIFESSDKDGLTIKGTTVYNFDVKKSFAKKIRETYIKDLLTTASKSGIRAIRNKYNSINAKEFIPKGRINGDTLLVCVL